MPIELSKETRDRAVASIKRFASEELDVEMGDLKAALVLDYVLREIAPSVYNQAVADAAKHLATRVEEMSGSVFVPEFGYWRKK
jgi:uncharacterized protein (DUF2164 family)